MSHVVMLVKELVIFTLILEFELFFIILSSSFTEFRPKLNLNLELQRK